jgi:uncharacterized membrane protein
MHRCLLTIITCTQVGGGGAASASNEGVSAAHPVGEAARPMPQVIRVPAMQLPSVVCSCVLLYVSAHGYKCVAGFGHVCMRSC